VTSLPLLLDLAREAFTLDRVGGRTSAPVSGEVAEWLKALAC
jgi:hypothetical protein